MPQKTDATIWQDIIISILSINQYTLSHTYRKSDELKAVGMFDPLNITTWNADEIEAKLKQGGCDRGEFMTRLFSERIAALGDLISDNGCQEFESVLLKGKTKDIENLLLPVKGIGPKVLKNFFLLRQAS